MKRAILSLALTFASVGWAQTPLIESMSPGCRDMYRFQLNKFASAVTDLDRHNEVNNMVHGNASCLIQFTFLRQKLRFTLPAAVAKALESIRTDKQTTAPVAGTGTSIISRGVAAKTIAVAAEAGALTETTKGQVVTVSGTLEGLPALLVRKNVLTYCNGNVHFTENCDTNDSMLRFLRKISFGVSFDTSQSSQTVTGSPSGGTGSGSAAQQAQQVTFAAKRHDITAITARYEIWNRRDVTSSAFSAALTSALGTMPAALSAAGRDEVHALDVLIPFINEAIEPLQSWIPVTVAALQAGPSFAANPLGAEQVLSERLGNYVDTILASPNSQDFVTTVTNLAHAVERFEQAKDELVDSVAVKPVISFEYADNRPVGQTPVSTFRLIGEVGWKKSNDLTFNGAFGVYDSAQPVVAGQPNSRLRDIEAGLQYERKLGSLPLLGTAAVDLSFYYQNQRSASILKIDPTQPLPGISFTGLPSNSNQVFALPGDIRLGQFRLVLGPGGSSVRVPIAVSYSNRTDLINKPGWRAQIGISYDFDSLFSK